MTRKWFDPYGKGARDGRSRRTWWPAAAPAGKPPVLNRTPLEAGGAAGLPVSLPEVHRSVGVPAAGTFLFLRRLLAFVGPGYLVAVGYMDPGNWATALAGGSAFGYTLLSVALLSSLMAMLCSFQVRLRGGTNRETSPVRMPELEHIPGRNIALRITGKTGRPVRFSEPRGRAGTRGGRGRPAAT